MCRPVQDSGDRPTRGSIPGLMYSTWRFGLTCAMTSAACCTRSRKYARPASMRAGGLFSRVGRRSERSRDQRETEERRSSDGVRDGRPHDRRRKADGHGDLTADNCHRAPAEPRPPRSRAMNAQRVGDADRKADHQNRAPSRRVDDPSGADGGRCGAKVEAGRGREPWFRRDRDGIGRAAREQQDDQERKRCVGDQVRVLQPGDGDDGSRPGREDEQ